MIKMENSKIPLAAITAQLLPFCKIRAAAPMNKVKYDR